MDSAVSGETESTQTYSFQALSGGASGISGAGGVTRANNSSSNSSILSIKSSYSVLPHLCQSGKLPLVLVFLMVRACYLSEKC